MTTHKTTSGPLAISYYILALLLAVFIMFFLPGVLDLSDKGYWLFMDERISFEGIRNIYQSPTFSKFIENISYGSDLRYGRLFWNLDAVTSYIPYLIWGEKGQILATRLTEFLLLAGSFLLLTKTFIKDQYLQLGAFCLMLFLPLTQYFLNEPKPEPAQLFFFSLFLYYAVKNNWQIKPYVILIGICLLLKISFLPLAGLLIVILIYHNRTSIFVKKAIPVKTLVLYFFIALGLVLLVYSFLIEPKLRSLVGQKAMYYQKLQSRAAMLKLFNGLEHFILHYSRLTRLLFVAVIASVVVAVLIAISKYTGKSIWMLVLYVFIGIIICTPCILFIPLNFKYLGYLIANNKLDHSTDDPSVNFITWLKFAFNGLFTAPAILLVLFLVTPFIAFAKNIKQIKISDKWLLALLLLIYLLCVVPIVLNVHRLWGHYLFVGYTFFIVLYFSVIEHEANKGFKMAYFVCPIILLVFFVMQSHQKVADYSKRTASAGFKQSAAEYDAAVSYINKSYNGKRQYVYWDPALFFPDGISKKDTAMVYYELFDKWHNGADFVVLSKAIPEYDTASEKHTLAYEQFLKAKKEFEVWNNPNTDSAFYYTRVDSALTRYKIYKKVIK